MTSKCFHSCYALLVAMATYCYYVIGIQYTKTTGQMTSGVARIKEFFNHIIACR